MSNSIQCALNGCVTYSKSKYVGCGHCQFVSIGMAVDVYSQFDGGICRNHINLLVRSRFASPSDIRRGDWLLVSGGLRSSVYRGEVRYSMIVNKIQRSHPSAKWDCDIDFAKLCGKYSGCSKI